VYPITQLSRSVVVPVSALRPPDVQHTVALRTTDAPIVAQDVGDNVGDALVQDAARRFGRLPFVQRRAVVRLHAEDKGRLDGVAAVGKDAVSLGHVQQPDFAAAQRDRQVYVRVVGQRLQPGVGGKLHHALKSDVLQRDDGGDIVGRRQRLAHQHRPVLDQPEVRGRVAFQLARDERRLHVQNHGRSGVRFREFRVHRGSVGKGLERAARLSQGQRRVDRAVYRLVE
jgi:hypothetical protein